MSALQLLAHAVGDYVLQNHWMATRKTSSIAVAVVHALMYTLPFLVLFGGSWALVPICLTHAVIDRYRLARYWCEWWGVGSVGTLWSRFDGDLGRFKRAARRCRTEWELRAVCEGPLATAAHQEPVEPPPPFLAVWLLIIVDNVMHVAINAASLRWLGG